MPVRMTGMISGLDTDYLIQTMIEAQRMKNKRVEDKSTLLTWKQDRWKELNTKLYKLYTEDLNKMRLQGSYLTKLTTSSNESLVNANAKSNAATGTHTLQINSLASAQSLTGGNLDSTTTASTKLTDLSISEGTIITVSHKGENKTLEVTADTTIADFVDVAKSAGLNANFDDTYKRLYISSKDSGTANGFEITASNGLELENLGLGSKVDIVNATNSEIVYNGVTYTGSSNIFNINGMEMTLKGEKPGETIYLNVESNTKGVYDMVKKFVTSYNDILKEMNELYYAPSSRGYDPLSDDEKEQMTEKEIDKWEDKIKDSILRNDSSLGSLLSSMKTSMMTSVEVDGVRYSLSSFGIQTSANYKENGLLHIFGDEDDAEYGMRTDKLLAALGEDPDKVMEVLSKISQNLYSTMADKMKAIPNVRSAFTFYNDKTMSKQQTDYAKKIAQLEAKLLETEDKYYKQFAAMETAMARLQSQSNALAGMLGVSNQK